MPRGGPAAPERPRGRTGARPDARRDPVTLRIRLGSRVLAPSVTLTVLLLLLCITCVLLGRWQWQRGSARDAQWRAFSRGAGEALAAPPGSLAVLPRFQRVRVSGRYDAGHQFLLDNRTHDGRAGFEVLTPLERNEGPVLLVDRGWVPLLGMRTQLPDVSVRTAPQVRIAGRVDDLPSAGLQIGRAAPARQGAWPRLTTYPTPAELVAAYGRPLDSRILLLDPGEPDGYVRDWHPPGISPLRNWSYAVQWWSFALLGVVFWVILSLERGVRT